MVSVVSVSGVGAAYRAVDRRKGVRRESCILTVYCVRLTFCGWDLVEEVEDEMKRDALKL